MSDQVEVKKQHAEVNTAKALATLCADRKNAIINLIFNESYRDRVVENND